MTVNQAGILYSSNDLTDKVIYSGDFTITVGLPVNSTTVINPDIVQGAYPVGLFSYDNGVTWNDCAGDATSYSVNTGITIRPPFTVNLFVNASTGLVTAQIVSPSGTSGTYTVLIQYVLLATDNPSILPAYPVVTTNPIAFTTNAGVYRKIIQSGIVTGTSDGKIHTTAHNLGAIPLVDSWSLSTSGIPGYNLQSCFVDAQWQGQSTGVGYVIAFDTTNIYTQFIASTAFSDYVYRIYEAQ